MDFLDFMDIEFIEPAHIPADEPRVFVRNGRACVNTRDLAEYYGRDHRT
jgi:hypothetical protein